MFGWFKKRAAKSVVEHVEDSIRRGKFDSQIEQIVIDRIRTGPDRDLTRIGFLLKMAVEIMDRSSPPITFQNAKLIALRAYNEFRRDNEGVRFGAPGWDWSGVGARIIAHDYEIDYWEAAST